MPFAEKPSQARDCNMIEPRNGATEMEVRPINYELSALMRLLAASLQINTARRAYKSQLVSSARCA